MPHNPTKRLVRTVGSPEKIVLTYGREMVERFLDSILPTAVDPLASLWTPDNWRCWLLIALYVPFLARTFHVLALPAVDWEDLDATIAICVVHCVPRDEIVTSVQKAYAQEMSCAWEGCVYHDVEQAVEKRVRVTGCKGCGEVRYCGRKCQRRDWLAPGGHRERCGRRLAWTSSNSEASIESAQSESGEGPLST